MRAQLRQRAAHWHWGPERLAVSVITALELREGAEMISSPAEYHRRVDVFLEYIQALPFPAAAARDGAILRYRLRKAGKPIGDFDSLIAAHARSLGLVLVTNNLREFARIPDLKLENWV